MLEKERKIELKPNVLGEEHWIGLENLHFLTRQKTYKLRVRLTDQYGKMGEGIFEYVNLNKKVKRLIVTVALLSFQQTYSLERL